MAVRVRRNVYSLPAGDDTLDWYRRAVAALQAEPLTSPTCWYYLGSVHGNPGFTPPSGASAFWDQCQHQTWYFLPWHRGYVAAMESIIAKKVVDLGGPADWALPYWNYSESQTANPDARNIPPAFRDPFNPDGSNNALWAPRNTNAAGSVGLRDADVALGALNEPVFTPPSNFGSGFGGGRTGFNHFGSRSDTGALENIPHNVVHVRIGGWMADPNTAGFDPIFWLHHCNIDRLWQEWIANSHTNPNEAAWLSGVSFPMHDGNGNAFTFTSANMQNTTQVLHGYVYDTLPAAPEAVVASAEGTLEMAQIDPELAGASDAPTPLDDDRTRAPVTMRPRTESAGAAAPSKVYLRLENVTGAGVPSDYDVLVDLDNDGQDPIMVGILSTFGIAGASNPDAEHGGAGISLVFDITEAAQTIGLTEALAPSLHVSFHKVVSEVIAEAVPIPGIEAAPATDGSVQVGRIGVYFE